VVLELDQRRRGERGPHRLAQAAGGLTAGRVHVHEVAPHRHDRARVPPDLSHVDPLDGLGLAPEHGAQHVELVGGHRHQHRLTGAHPVAHEVEGRAHELGIAGVEPNLVPEARPHSDGAHWRTLRAARNEHSAHGAE
jgi:hypothetical protein